MFTALEKGHCFSPDVKVQRLALFSLFKGGLDQQEG